MSYHAVVRALESQAGVTPLRRFWFSVRGCVQGQLPYARYQKAGLARQAEGARPGEVERWMLDWEHTDLNPIVQIARTSNSIPALIDCYNTFNQRSCVDVLTTLRVEAGQPTFARSLRRSNLDPEPCKTTTIFAMRMMLRIVAPKAGKAAGEPKGLPGVARTLGIEGSASAELSAAFEQRSSWTVADAARELGCSARTLQRALKREGGSAEEIKLASRIVSAMRLMAQDLSLTEIAHLAGFSDSAHMSRSFMSSCSLTPTEVRRACHPTRHFRSSVKGAAA